MAGSGSGVCEILEINTFPIPIDSRTLAKDGSLFLLFANRVFAGEVSDKRLFKTIESKIQ